MKAYFSKVKLCKELCQRCIRREISQMCPNINIAHHNRLCSVRVNVAQLLISYSNLICATTFPYQIICLQPRDLQFIQTEVMTLILTMKLFSQVKVVRNHILSNLMFLTLMFKLPLYMSNKKYINCILSFTRKS